MADTLRLVSMPEESFRGFSDLLYEKQARHLMTLCQAVEPAVRAFVKGELIFKCPFHFEGADAKILSFFPKGSADVLKLLAGTCS
jgi:hypothetical protein